MARDPGRRPRLLRGTLLFLLGGLVGANAMYYMLSRGGVPSPVVAWSVRIMCPDCSPPTL